MKPVAIGESHQEKRNDIDKFTDMGTIEIEMRGLVYFGFQHIIKMPSIMKLLKWTDNFIRTDEWT